MIKIKHPPLKHQQKVIDLLKNKDKFILNLDMGLGKTYISLYHWLKNINKGNLLVVGLNSGSEIWEQELNKFFVGVKINKLNKGSKQAINTLLEAFESKVEGQIFVLPYSILFKMKEVLQKIGNKDKDFFTVIIDESHKVKNTTSKVGKVSKNHLSKFNHIYLLTGTPTSLGAQDWYNQLAILSPKDERIRTKTSFTENFLITEKQYFFKGGKSIEFYKVVGQKNEELFNEILSNYKISMNLEQSGIELPEKMNK